MADPVKAVFLSYASEDAEIARSIGTALRRAGIEVWFDQSELHGGDAWDAAIRKQIKSCALFIPVISVNTHRRVEGYFRLEWKLAVDRSYLMDESLPFLLPVVVDTADDLEERVPERFKEVQWTRMADGVVPNSFPERVAQLLSVEASERPPTHLSQGAAEPATRKSSLMLAVIIAVILAAIVSGWFALHGRLTPERSVLVTPPIDPGAHPVPEAIPQKSIAVLAFTDMSQKKDQEYFSDGLSEELINQLSRIAGLRVPARTSSFYFKGRSDDIATIASKLRVAYVLEGSVRKLGDRLRVTADLIRADNGYHTWAETFDLKLKDVFKVQDDIAAAVVNALKLTLAPGQAVSSQLTLNPDAYTEYLLARELYRRGDIASFRLAVGASRKAIVLDPNFGAAFAELALDLFSVADFTGSSIGFRQAFVAADKAVSLAPNEATGYLARGFLRSNHSRDWAGADADYRKALSLEPDNAAAYNNYGQLLQSLGRLPEAIAAAKKSTELNPLSGAAWQNLTRFLIDHGDFSEAQVAARRASEISPLDMISLNNLGTLELLQGHGAEALQTFRKIGFEGFRQQGIAMAEHTLGNARESQQALDDLSSKHGQDGPYEIAEIYAWRGETDKSFEWLNRAYELGDGGLANLKSDPLLASLRNDARYAALVKKMGLPLQVSF